MLHERRLIALALVVAGIWVQWGPGFALIVAGVGYAFSGFELAPRVAAIGSSVGRGWTQVRAAATTVPRRAAAVALMAVAAVMLPVAALAAAGAWAGLAAFGGMTLVAGTALGWE